MLSPAYFSETKGDKLLNAMISLNAKTGAVSVIPTIPGSTLTYDSKKYSLTAAQQQELKQKVGVAQKQAATDFIIKGKKIDKKYAYKTTDGKDRRTNSLIGFTKVINKSKGLYTDDDLRAKVLDGVMQDAYEKAVADFVKAHKDLVLKK